MSGFRPFGPKGSVQMPGGQGSGQSSGVGGGAVPQARAGFYAEAERELSYNAAPLWALGAVSEAVMTVPLMDTRASLGSVSGYDAQAYAIENVLFGTTLDLFIDTQIDGYVTVADDYRIFFLEYGTAVDPRLGDFVETPDAAYTQLTEITLQFNQGAIDVSNATNFRSILRFTPTGPLRYWGIKLIFAVYDNIGSVSSTRCSGALH